MLGADRRERAGMKSPLAEPSARYRTPVPDRPTRTKAEPMPETTERAHQWLVSKVGARHDEPVRIFATKADAKRWTKAADAELVISDYGDDFVGRTRGADPVARYTAQKLPFGAEAGDPR